MMSTLMAILLPHLWIHILGGTVTRIIVTLNLKLLFRIAPELQSGSKVSVKLFHSFFRK